MSAAVIVGEGRGTLEGQLMNKLSTVQLCLLQPENPMAQYMISYIGGNQPATPEEGQAHMAKYKEWLAGLADAAVSPANPLKGTTTVNSDRSLTEGGSTGMSGYTVVEAESMEVALDIARACPFLDIGGSLEVSELMKMPF